MNKEAIMLVEKLKRVYGAKRLIVKAGRKGRSQPTSKRSWYINWQKLWKRERATAAALILEGDPPRCEVETQEVQKTYESLWEGTDGFSFLGQDGKLPMADNSGLTVPISKMEVLSKLRKMKSKGSPGMDGIKKGHLMAYDKSGEKLAAM